jgi:hypothetical protein
VSKIYKVVYEISLPAFVQKVNDQLKEGWELIGGMAISPRGINPTQIDKPMFCQSMVLNVSVDKLVTQG